VKPRNDLREELQLFAADLRGKAGQSRHVSTRTRQAGDEPAAYGILIPGHDNGNRRRGVLGIPRVYRTGRDNDIDIETHGLGSERGRSIHIALRRPILNDNVVPFHVAKLAQPLAECLDAGRNSGKGGHT
jgi:hypothetical protein